MQTSLVSPAFASFTENMLLGEVWKRPGLSLRDRSVVTVAAMISRNQTVGMAEHIKLALDNGVMSHEISEIIFHLAFYAGWANAASARWFHHALSAAIAIQSIACRSLRPLRLPKPTT
jgi:4-carboxymuconolactone decarboxylase